jgi:hypothetical protein
MKNISKYETLEQLKLRFNRRVATTDEEMQYINRVLKAASARDRCCAPALVTIPPNSFPFLAISTLDKTFHPKLTIFVGTLLKHDDAENIINRLAAAIPTN